MLSEVHLSMGETDQAVKTLEEAMKLPGIRTVTHGAFCSQAFLFSVFFCVARISFKAL